MTFADAVREIKTIVGVLARCPAVRGAAVLTGKGTCLADGGRFAELEMEALMALASRGLRASGAMKKLLAGEEFVVEVGVDGATSVHVMAVGRRLLLMSFVDDVALLGTVRLAVGVAAKEIESVVALVRAADVNVPGRGAPGGSTPGDANLPVIELGVTPQLGPRRGPN